MQSDIAWEKGAWVEGLAFFQAAAFYPGRDTPQRILVANFVHLVIALGVKQAENSHWRLQQQIRRMTAAETASRVELAAAVRQLKHQEDEIGTLRQELGRLQLRHSSAVRALS